MAIPPQASFIGIAFLALALLLIALRARRAGHLPPLVTWSVIGLGILAIISLFVWPILPFTDRRLDEGIPMRDGPARAQVEDPAAPALGAPAPPGESSGTPLMADYLVQASAADLFEVQSGSLAMRRGQSSAVRELGERFAREHRASSETLQRLSKTVGLDSPPPALTQTQSAMLRRMDRAASEQFDQIWLELQADAHGTALALHTKAARTLPPGQMAAFAKAMAQKVTTHREDVLSIARNAPNR